MIARLSIAVVSAALLKALQRVGGFREILTFNVFKDTTLLGTIISNLLVVIVFAELYWALDQDETEKHFGFGDPLDAYYYSTVTSSSVGYGDLLPKTRKAKVLTMVHILTMFFLVLPVISEALKLD
jgi:hypothetical protein